MNYNNFQNNGTDYNYNGYGFNNGNGFQGLNSAENSKRLKSIYSTLGLGLCFFFGIMMFMQVVIISATMAVDSSVMREGWYNLFLSDVPIYGVALWVLMFFFSKVKAEKIEKKKFGIGNSLAVFPVACFITVAGSILGNYADKILQMIFNVEVGDVLTETAASMSLPVQIIFFVIIAPFGEELIFRKLLLDRTAKYGEGAAILFSGLTFALFHGNITQVFYAFGAGLLLAYIYVKTGSYIRCVLLHAGVNAVFGVIVPQLYKYIDSDDKIMKTVATLVVNAETILVLAGIIIFIVFLACKKVHIKKSEYPLSSSAVQNALSNAPFIVFVVLTSLLIVMNYASA